MTRQCHALLIGWLYLASLGACTETANRPAKVRPGIPSTGDPVPAMPRSVDSASETTTGTEVPRKSETAASGGTAPERGKNAITPSVTAVRHKPRFSRKSAIYDRTGEGFAVLQAPASAMQHFPADSLGNIDWVSTLSRGLIKPRASVTGRGQMRQRTDDVIMRNTRDMPWVRFPHRQHTEWLDCSNCHPMPFEAKNGGNRISMESIMRGQHCGVCHDRVAFSIFACERCHSVLHEGSPAAWW